MILIGVALLVYLILDKYFKQYFEKVQRPNRNRQKETPYIRQSENKNNNLDIESNGLLYTLEDTNKNELNVSIEEVDESGPQCKEQSTILNTHGGETQKDLLDMDFTQQEPPKDPRNEKYMKR